MRETPCQSYRTMLNNTPKEYKVTKSLRICPYRVIDAAKSRLHGAIDPKSRHAKRGAGPVGIHVLQPACIGRADCLRGNANLAHGKGLYQHPRHPFARSRSPAGSRSSMQYTARAGESFFSSGTWAESLTAACCRETHPRWRLPRLGPARRQSLRQGLSMFRSPER